MKASLYMGNAIHYGTGRDLLVTSVLKLRVSLSAKKKLPSSGSSSALLKTIPDGITVSHTSTTTTGYQQTEKEENDGD
jgi:hypothetical protein